MVKQSGHMDSRGGMVADKLILAAGAYPWYVNGATASTVLEPAVAMGGTTGDALTQDVSYGYATVSFDAAPPAGTTFEVWVGNALKVKTYLSAVDGIQVIPFGFTFLSGTQNCFVKVLNAGTVNKSITLHNVR